MSSSDSNSEAQAESGGNQWFATTHWSVVRAAGGNDDPSSAAEALEALCGTYWAPIYGFLRRTGYSSADAEDLTQDYFAHLLRKNLAHRADPGKGRFRSFLLHTLKQFAADQRSKAKAKKRGGDYVFVSLDFRAEELRVQSGLATNLSPDRIFEQRWVEVILDRVVSQLEREYVETGRKNLFDHLKVFQPGEQPEMSYEEAASRLRLSLPAVKSAIHRMRRRHGELLREEIAQTVSSPKEIDDEVRFFISCWSR